MMRLLLSSSLILLFSWQNSYAQTSKEEPLPLDTAGQFILDPETKVPLTINLDAEEEEEEDEVKAKEKKRKKKVFYDIKTKKGYAQSGYGQSVVMELFYYLKEYEEPNEYIRDVYWYDTKDRKIKTTRIEKENARILHGPYKKMYNDQVLEEGYFYVGVKHGRWMYHDKKDILQDKEKYYKGWPKNSEITYFDEEKRENLKEVIPIEFGEKEGNYFLFHENGQLAVKGEYRYGKKVGVWTEYYKYRRRRKREIQYPQDPFDDDFRPYILKEWNDKGQLIYDRRKNK